MNDLSELQRLARAATDLGHYNLAKLLSAAHASISNRALQTASLPKTDRALAGALQAVLPSLIESDLDPALLDLIQRAADTIAGGQLVLYPDSPPVWVCRACGAIALRAAPDICPACGAGQLTFQYFPPAYYLEPVPIDDLMAQLARTPDWLDATLADLSPAQIGRQVDGTEGAWSLLEAAGHLLDAQDLIAHRVRLFMTEAAPDLNAKAVWQMGEASALSAAEIAARFRGSRAAMLRQLQSAAPNDWQRIGHHTEFGPVTLQQQCSYFAKHEQWHMAQMTRIRRALIG